MELINSIDRTFMFDNKTVRVIGTHTDPWFIVKDICNILGLTNSTIAIKQIPLKWKKIINIETSGGNQPINIINEAGLYKLVMRSNKPIAQKFQDTVCEEILPTIRKTGQFILEDLIAKNKKNEAEIEWLKIENEKIKTELLKEQKLVIETKKKLNVNQSKFTARHKFEEKPCVYILQNPDDKYEKYKIGMTQNINQRLAVDRTTIPNIKVRYILYTSEYMVFETIIKIRLRDELMMVQHEWVFESLDNLIAIYQEIDKTMGYNSEVETELWRYNLEDPEAEKKVELKPPQYVPEVMIEKIVKNVDKFTGILPYSLPRIEYVIKNKQAGPGLRYCNAFCQEYRSINDFTKRSIYLLTNCVKCEQMADTARTRILSGVLTEEEIRKNPSLLLLGETEKICLKCNIVKNKSEFPDKRNQCRQCRNKVRSKYGKNFDLVLEKEIETLKSLSFEEKCKKLDSYTKVELQKIGQYFNLGRKYNDNKRDTYNKLIEYFKMASEAI